VFIDKVGLGFTVTGKTVVTPEHPLKVGTIE
jgi:hypothetical protein